MSLAELFSSRRTVHHFERTELKDGVLERALEAAVTAPNHKLTFPWRFTVVGRESRKALCQLQERLKREKGEPVTPEILERVSEKLLDPPVLLVVGWLRDLDESRDRENYAAVACAIQNLMLSLWHDGVGSKWGTGALTRHPDSYSLLGWDSSLQTIAGFIWIGIPKNIPVGSPRPSFRELTRYLP